MTDSISARSDSGCIEPPQPPPQQYPVSRLREKLYSALLVVLLVLIGWYYCHAIDTEILGFTHDDGVYAVAGKSLAQGKGFKLLHVVGEPGQIKYPFLYPAILSVVWLFNPHFPQNLPALNYITITFTLASCWLIYLYLRQCQKFPGWLALLIIGLATSSYFFIYFFTTVMSEAPYLFLSLLTLWYLHRASSKYPERLPEKAVSLLVILSAATFLTRVTGIALIGAIGVWLLLNRQWRNAARYGLGTLALGILPWILWVKFNTPVMTVLSFPLVNTYSNYGFEFLHNVQSSNYLAGLQRDFSVLLQQMLQDMTPVIPNFLRMYPQFKPYPNMETIVETTSIVLAYLLFGYYLLQGVSTMRKSVAGGRFNTAVFTVPGLYICFYLILITLWHYEDQMARFLVVLLPLLWMYFFKPMVPFLPEFGEPLPTSRLKMGASLAVVAVIGALVLVPGSHSYNTVHVSRNEHWVESGKYRWMWREYQHSFNWIKKSTPQNARLAVGSDVVYYLYTDRPTFYVFYASLRRAEGRFLPESIPLLMKSLDHYNMQYLVAEPHMQARMVRFPVNLVAKQLLDTYPKRFEKVYSSPRGAINIYKILPPSKNP